MTVKGRIEDVEIWDNNVEAVVTIKLESGLKSVSLPLITI